MTRMNKALFVLLCFPLAPLLVHHSESLSSTDGIQSGFPNEWSIAVQTSCANMQWSRRWLMLALIGVEAPKPWKGFARTVVVAALGVGTHPEQWVVGAVEERVVRVQSSHEHAMAHCLVLAPQKCPHGEVEPRLETLSRPSPPRCPTISWTPCKSVAEAASVEWHPLQWRG